MSSSSPILIETTYVPDHYWHTMVPNFLKYSALDPYDFRVYFEVLSTSGQQGACWSSIKTMSENTGIGETKVKECLKNLCTGKNKYGIKYLSKTERKNEAGSSMTSVYGINDVWKFNGDYFRKMKQSKQLEKSLGGRHATGGGSPRDYKEEPLEEERKLLPKKEKPPKTVVVPPILNQLKLKQAIINRILKDNSSEEIELAAQRALNWKGRKSDEAAILSALKNKDSWTDLDQEKKKEEAKKLETTKALEENAAWAKDYVNKIKEKHSIGGKILNASGSAVSIRLKGEKSNVINIQYDTPNFKKTITEYVKKLIK